MSNILSNEQQVDLKPDLDLLLRSLPMKDAENTTTGIKTLLKGLGRSPPDLQHRLEFPLRTIEDPTANGKKYIPCELSREGNSYRSPWTNKYFPPLPGEEQLLPSEKTRKMEQDANELFEAYKDLYYMGGINGTSSAYFKDTSSGFEACFLIKREVADNAYVQHGGWDSINYVTAAINEEGTDALYKLTTTVQVRLDVNKTDVGETSVAGMLSKSTELTSRVDAAKTPLAVIGRMIEDMETELRLSLNDVYILKTKEVVDSLRTTEDALPTPPQTHMDTLNNAVLSLGLKKDEHIIGGV